MSLITQKVRYPRSCNRFQSANSQQKAKRPSPGKRKISNSSSYTNSEWPSSLKYISMSYRSLPMSLQVGSGNYLPSAASHDGCVGPVPAHLFNSSNLPLRSEINAWWDALAWRLVSSVGSALRS